MITPTQDDQTLTQLEDDIRAGKIRMRPKVYFSATYGLKIIGILLTLFACISLGSFTLFSLRANGTILLPSLGWRGLQIFLHHVPWLLLLLIGLFVVALEWASQRFAFVYRKPLLYSSIIILSIVGLGSVFVEQSSIHRRLFHNMSTRHVPFISPFYKGYGEIHPTDFHLVYLLDAQGSQWQAKNRYEERVTIFIGRDTQFPFGHEIRIGDRLLVIGDKNDNIIQARIIRRLQPNALPE